LQETIKILEETVLQAKGVLVRKNLIINIVLNSLKITIILLIGKININSTEGGYMEKDAFLDIFKSHRLSLPIESDDRDIYTLLKSHFGEYHHLLKRLSLPNEVLQKLTRICESILASIEHYYLGSPAEAYIKIKIILNDMYNNNQLILYKKNEHFTKYNTSNDPLNLYRVRPINDEKQYTRKEIFHVPFSKRRFVSSSRFSIAGYPSLYLGTSHDLSRIETGLKKDDNYIVSKFKIEREYAEALKHIYVLDLAIKPDEIEKFSDSKYFYDVEDEQFRISYIEAYPLITACSIMVKKKNKNFYPEYIIPQLVMQWLNERANIDKHSIYGIRYFTCRSKSPRIEGLNYVFPVQSFDIVRNVEEYCNVLASIFKLTEPISSKVHNFEGIMETGNLRKIY